MTSALITAIGFIPTNVWGLLKKFVTEDTGGVVIYDNYFKISSKYTPALMVILICLSAANQFARNIDIDFTTTELGSKLEPKNEIIDHDYFLTEFNNYCWNYQTYIVVSALQPQMRGKVTYPGVFSHKIGEEILVQRYYKYVWLVLSLICVIPLLALYIWKTRGIRRLKSIIEGEDTATRAKYTVEAFGFNEVFARQYMLSKFLGAIAPFISFILVCVFVGKYFKKYGYEVITHHLSDENLWPDPMDRLFPKMAKCDFSRYGFAGDLERISGQCHLTMNNYTQWIFFIVWWWLVVNQCLQIISLFQFLLNIMCPCCRDWAIRSVLLNICEQQIDLARRNIEIEDGVEVTRITCRSDELMTNICFSDWLLLHFLQKNMLDWEYREFIRKLIEIDNNVIFLRHGPPS